MDLSSHLVPSIERGGFPRVGCCSRGLGLMVMAGFLTGLSFSLYLQFQVASALELK